MISEFIRPVIRARSTRRAWIAVLATGFALVPLFAHAEYEGPDCVTHRGHVIYQAYGYTHFVAIENGCEEAVSCRVRTSATSAEVRVRLDASSSKEIVTRRGSPAREFAVTLRCETE